MFNFTGFKNKWRTTISPTRTTLYRSTNSRIFDFFINNERLAIFIKPLTINMKNLFKLGVCTLAMLFSVSAFAQNAADKIVGVYKVEEDGNQSKVRFTKCDDGTYQGQIIWLSQPNHPDGTRKMDLVR